MLERKIERLGEMRLAQHGEDGFDTYYEDLQMRLMIMRQPPVDEFIVDSRPQFREFVNQLKGALSPLNKDQIEKMSKDKVASMKKAGG